MRTEQHTTSTKFHPAIFQLEDRISLKNQFLPVPGLNIYTDAQRWKTKHSEPSVSWKKTQRNTNGWCNFVPSTQSSKQSFLPYRRLVFGQARPTNRLRAHVGYSGNEAADVLAKKATQEGIPTYISIPRNHIKSLLQKESIIHWQKEWDEGETGRSVHNVLPKVKTTPTPWQKAQKMFVKGHGPFPTYLKQFNIRNRLRFLRLQKPGKSLTLCYKLPVYNLIPPKKTVS
ncbi:hypothetical protein AVEN_16595-1 [Araneus ventricosus]|uniref:RNase H type-1 domain-containing protein n=1 Tax=Araneus ventricosus TaxID=182803 RepID=A0A4Y2JNR5_ARAVE|nr:hypothetical protein AVEN_16595-1 [Araneus ventricosus]